MDPVKEVLAHYGVKGMHWGVRRERIIAPVSPTRTPGATSVDAKRANKLQVRAQTHGTGNLSNKEMRDLIDRMNMEQQYSRLNTQPETTSAGYKVAKTLLKRVGPSALVTVFDSMAKKSGDPRNQIAVAVLSKALSAKSLIPSDKKKK